MSPPMDFLPNPRHQDSSSLPLSLFSSETTSSSSSTKTTSKDMMMMMMMQGGVQQSGYFSIGQWQELEVQALIFRHMLSASPIPPHLLHLLLNSSTNNLNNFPPLYQTGGGYWGRGGMDPEPGRCKRTDGKKWRCSRDVVSGHKYCERHIHRGRNRSRKPVEVPTPMATTTNTASSSYLRGGAGGYFDQAHEKNQRIQEMSQNETKPSTGRVLRPFFDDWPKTVEQQEVLATSLSISVPGDVGSDFSLKLSTGNNDGGSRVEEINGDRERGVSNWGMLWGTHNAGSMGGPLAEALRSSSVSNSSSPTSVLHQLQRGSSTTASETSYVST